MTADATDPDRTIIRRPGIGVPIDPSKLSTYRNSAMLNRLELAEATARVDPEGRGVSRDAIAKIENADRKRPKIRTLRMIIDALNEAFEARGKPLITIEDLEPDPLPRRGTRKPVNHFE